MAEQKEILIPTTQPVKPAETETDGGYIRMPKQKNRTKRILIGCIIALAAVIVFCAVNLLFPFRDYIPTFGLKYGLSREEFVQKMEEAGFTVSWESDKGIAYENDVKMLGETAHCYADYYTDHISVSYAFEQGDPENIYRRLCRRYGVSDETNQSSAGTGVAAIPYVPWVSIADEENAYCLISYSKGESVHLYLLYQK